MSHVAEALLPFCLEVILRRLQCIVQIRIDKHSNNGTELTLSSSHAPRHGLAALDQELIPINSGVSSIDPSRSRQIKLRSLISLHDAD